MKKIFTSIIVVAMLLTTSLVNASAFTKDESYQAAKKYYETKKVLQGADEVITYESLGLESDDLAMEYVVNTEYASTIAKTVIALTLHGDDPRNYEGVNYVEMLENCVHENGAVDKEKDEAAANYQYICVNALYTVSSDKTQLAAEYLASLANVDNGAFGYAGGFDDVSVTGWVIEILSLVNKEKYQLIIEKAIEFIQSKQIENAGYDGYGFGVDPNTQACALMGLLTYDEAGVKGNTYNKGENNPYDFLLTFQNDDGSFWYSEPGEDNEWATYQGNQVVGYYYNGSVYKKAYYTYQELIKPVEIPEEKPVETPEQKPNVKPEEKPVEDKKDVVNTADATELFGYTSLLLMSAFVFMKGRKEIEQN